MSDDAITAATDVEAPDADALSLDALLDLALMHSFPASDPPALVASNGRRPMDRSAAFSLSPERLPGLDRYDVLQR